MRQLVSVGKYKIVYVYLHNYRYDDYDFCTLGWWLSTLWNLNFTTIKTIYLSIKNVYFLLHFFIIIINTENEIKISWCTKYHCSLFMYKIYLVMLLIFIYLFICWNDIIRLNSMKVHVSCWWFMYFCFFFYTK